jgi:hypothetical protein
MAPHLAAIHFFESNSILGDWNNVVAMNLDKQLSTSFIFPPTDPTEAGPIFQEMAVQGQSFFVAAGDG